MGVSMGWRGGTSLRFHAAARDVTSARGGEAADPGPSRRRRFRILRRRSRLLVGLVPVVLLMAGAPGATASAGHPYSLTPIPGPSTFSTGFAGGLSQPDPASSLQNPWYPVARSLDATWVRVVASWLGIAPLQRPAGFDATNPADPAYNWGPIDASVEAAVAVHEHVLITITTAPAWAEGPHPPARVAIGSWDPNATDLGQFAEALARRYDGSFPNPENPLEMLPRVSDFQIWNEPNIPSYLSPQWKKVRHGYQPESPIIYRSMLNAGYAAIKSVQPNAYVLAGGTEPYGDPPGVGRIHPVLFISALLCLHVTTLKKEPCPDPAHFDALDSHPYSFTPTIHAYNSLDASVPDFSRFERVVAVALRDGTALPRRPKPYWVTEIAWGSNPPDSTNGISLAVQARYLSLSFYEFWRQAISNVFWLQIVDDEAEQNPFGVYLQNGRPKPAAQAFRFPFVALAHGSGKLLLWGRAPGHGLIKIQARRGRSWHNVLTLETTSGGVFYEIASLPSDATLRAVQGSVSSPGYSVG